MSKKRAKHNDPARIVDNISDLLRQAIKQGKAEAALQAAQKVFTKHDTIESIQDHLSGLKLDGNNRIVLQRVFNALEDITTPPKVHKNKYAHLVESAPDFTPED